MLMVQGRKKILWDGGADRVGSPTSLGGLGACFPRKYVCSEINPGVF